MESVMGLYKAFAGEKAIYIGRRRISEERQLSEGGFAFVSLAKDLDTNESFALKKTKCQTQEMYNLALQEAQTLENLAPHPNIVTYYGSGVETIESGMKYVYLLMEFCTGGHLLDLLQNLNGKLEERLIVKIFTDVTMSLFHLHSQTPPLIHRDVKLENILRSSNGLFKLCDFGSATTTTLDTSTMTRQQIIQLEEYISKTTTLVYRPPEMVDLYKKLQIGEKSDIWMLGCILYSLIFNRHPFQESSVLAIVNATFTIDPVIAKKFPKLIDLIFWMLFPDPNSRPSSEDLLDVLQRYNALSLIPLPQEVASRKTAMLEKTKSDISISTCQLKDIDIKVGLKDHSPTKPKKKDSDQTDSGKSTTTKHHKGSSKRSFCRDTSKNFKCKNQVAHDFLFDFQTDPFVSVTGVEAERQPIITQDWLAFPDTSENKSSISIPSSSFQPELFDPFFTDTTVSTSFASNDKQKMSLSSNSSLQSYNALSPTQSDRASAQKYSESSNLIDTFKFRSPAATSSSQCSRMTLLPSVVDEFSDPFASLRTSNTTTQTQNKSKLQQQLQPTECQLSLFSDFSAEPSSSTVVSFQSSLGQVLPQRNILSVNSHLTPSLSPIESPARSKITASEQAKSIFDWSL